MSHNTRINILANQINLQNTVFIFTIATTVNSGTQIINSSLSSISQRRYVSTNLSLTHISTCISNSHTQTITQFTVELTHICQCINYLSVCFEAHKPIIRHIIHIVNTICTQVNSTLIRCSRVMHKIHLQRHFCLIIRMPRKRGIYIDSVFRNMAAITVTLFISTIYTKSSSLQPASHKLKIESRSYLSPAPCSDSDIS